MSNEQCDVAIVGQVAYCVEQGVAASVVEKISDLQVIGIELIELEQFKSLSRPRCARAQHGVDHDLLVSQVVANLLCVVFTVGRESSLAVPATRSYVLGLCMAKYEQGASLVHSSSLMWRFFCQATVGSRTCLLRNRPERVLAVKYAREQIRDFPSYAYCDYGLSRESPTAENLGQHLDRGHSEPYFFTS
jgi:hypothetical protein